MSASVKKITVNLPVEALRKAQAITGQGITPTLIEALHELDRQRKRSALRALKGRIDFKLDLPRTRR